MARTARVITALLFAIGALGAGAAAIWIASVSPGDGGGVIARALWLVGDRLGAAVYAMLAVAALGAVALGWFAARGRRWPLVVAIAASPAGIALAWIARHLAAQMEDPHFRRKSPYVHAATDVAIAATIYLALLAISATVALIAERRRAVSPVSAAPG